MTHTVILASFVVCAAAYLLLGAHRRRTRRTDPGHAGWPAPIAGAEPVRIGAPVAAGAPMVAGAPMAVGAPAPAPAPAPAFSVARRKQNSGSSHFSRPRANTRPVQQPLH